jgi:hypothetical protein
VVGIGGRYCGDVTCLCGTGLPVVGTGGLYCGDVTCLFVTGVLSGGDWWTLLRLCDILVWYRITDWWELVDGTVVI